MPKHHPDCAINIGEKNCNCATRWQHVRRESFDEHGNAVTEYIPRCQLDPFDAIAYVKDLAGIDRQALARIHMPQEPISDKSKDPWLAVYTHEDGGARLRAIVSLDDLLAHAPEAHVHDLANSYDMHSYNVLAASEPGHFPKKINSATLNAIQRGRKPKDIPIHEVAPARRGQEDGVVLPDNAVTRAMGEWFDSHGHCSDDCDWKECYAQIVSDIAAEIGVSARDIAAYLGFPVDSPSQGA